MPRKTRLNPEHRASVALVSVDATSADSEADQEVSQETEPEHCTGGTPVHLVVPPASDDGARRFGSYEIVWELCRDALSVTYAARRDGIEGLLALRVFNARLTDSAQVRSIKKAAQKAAELTHVNHVTVYECGVNEAGSPYVVKEWVEGETFAETLAVAKRLDIARFLHIFNQVCDALSEAHSHQLVHGNLSPNKIMVAHQDDVDHELVKLIDFGMPPDPVQNAFYLSPEQRLDATRMDQRSDIYSLGCIMYESLMGRPPFTGDRAYHASSSYLHELASQHAADTPEHNALKLLDCIIIKCLQKDPRKRFRNVREVADALRMVADCICNGNTRKLPPKAEKLLLFRFLNFFDKKVVTCMFLYLLLGLTCQKYLGEIQLQRHIDEGQLSGHKDLPRTTSAWRAALAQAQQMHKPPALQADLHWELANSLNSEVMEAIDTENKNALAQEACSHYDRALDYYSHGAHYRSYSLSLLHSMTSLWILQTDDDRPRKAENSIREQMRKLIDQKKYAEVARLAKEQSGKFNDYEINKFAGIANAALGAKLSPEKALPYLQHAQYYFNDTSPTVGEDQLSACLQELGYDDSASDTHEALGVKALKEGDFEAAQAHFVLADGSAGSGSLREAIRDLRDYRVRAFEGSVKFTGLKQAIEPLRRILQLQEAAYGPNSKTLTTTLLSLADCYADTGETQKAIDTYKRYFKMASKDGFMPSDTVLKYVDLLDASGKKTEARKELEKRVRGYQGSFDVDPLYIRLLEMYKAQKMNSQLRSAVDATIDPPQPVKLIKYIPMPENYRYTARTSGSSDGDPFSAE